MHSWVAWAGLFISYKMHVRSLNLLHYCMCYLFLKLHAFTVYGACSYKCIKLPTLLMIKTTTSTNYYYTFMGCMDPALHYLKMHVKSLNYMHYCMCYVLLKLHIFTIYGAYGHMPMSNIYEKITCYMNQGTHT